MVQGTKLGAPKGIDVHCHRHSGSSKLSCKSINLISGKLCRKLVNRIGKTQRPLINIELFEIERHAFAMNPEPSTLNPRSSDGNDFAMFAEYLSQHVGDLADGRIGLDRRQDGGEKVGISPRRRVKLGQGPLDRAVISAPAQLL